MPRLWVEMMLLSLGLSLTACQRGSPPEQSVPIAAPAPEPVQASATEATAQVAAASSVMVYINMKLHKKYGLLARTVGGMRDVTWESTTYDPAKPWWNNPLIAYSEPPLLEADVTGRSDSEPIIGEGKSRNVAVHVTLKPYADVAVKTMPKSDCMRGTITVTITAASEYYDGRWVNLVREDGKKLTFSFDTCDPLRRMEVVASETRTIPTFTLERYTRDEQKWEPRSQWPGQPKSGDWRVVIAGKAPTLQITYYRYVKEPAEAQTQL